MSVVNTTEENANESTSRVPQMTEVSHFSLKVTETKESQKSETQNELETELKREFDNYEENLSRIWQGKGLTKDIYYKIISQIQEKNFYLMPLEKQKEEIKKIVSENFLEEDQVPNILRLYPDVLQYTQMKDLQFQNTPEQTKNFLLDFYMKKYFKLNNIREKILTKANQILNYKEFNEKFSFTKDFKVGKINQEINSTIKRIIRLMDIDEERVKDTQYYFHHFNVKKMDAFFLKKKQSRPFHNLTKDDFEIYFREKIYQNRTTLHLQSFIPYIKYSPVKSGIEIWKNSKIYLNTTFKKYFSNIMKKIEDIYKAERISCSERGAGSLNDEKVLKDYFQSKYSVYYDMQKDLEDTKNFTPTNYDVFYPPFIISLNAEIKPYLKELCEYYSITFDLKMDNGKAFANQLEAFYLQHFSYQNKHFIYNSYHLTFNELISCSFGIEQTDKINEDKLQTETQVIRNKYDRKKGFFVQEPGKRNLMMELEHSTFQSDIYVKAALWVKYICVLPDIDLAYESQMKYLNDIGYVDSNFKYILEIIEKVDRSTLSRLIEDYTLNTKAKIRNTLRLISKKEEGNYSQLRELVKEIIPESDLEATTQNASFNPKNPLAPNQNKYINPHDEYTDRIDSDLLKYLMTLRFLKLRDYKYYILNLLNYFRYVQKRLTIDCYKIETRNWKKEQDLSQLVKELDRSLPYPSAISTSSAKNGKIIISKPISEFSKTNPLVPSIDKILENKMPDSDSDTFNNIFIEDIDETIELTEKEVHVKDSKGHYILYDATLSDMKQLEEEFCKVGTYYIQKKERLVVNTDKTPNFFLDRTQVILDLFLNEFDFLYAKFEYISEMMTIYENTSDIFIQKKIMKDIINAMSHRPILDLDYNYFTGSYIMETELLKKKAALMHLLIDFQKKVEFQENKQLYDTIDKYYWLLGEAALEIIQHVRLDKEDIESIKKILRLKKNQMSSLSEKEKLAVKDLDDFMSLFIKINEEKSYENEDKLGLEELNKNEEDDIKIENEKEELNLKDDSSNSKSEEEKEESFKEENKKGKEDLNKDKSEKLNVLLKMLRNLFSLALTGGDTKFLDTDEDSKDLLKENKELNEELKENVIMACKKIESEDKNPMRKKKFDKKNNEESKSCDISNTVLDTLNYQVRSLLNIPNPFVESTFMEKNQNIISSMNKETSFIRFEEGYPQKFLDAEDYGVKVNEIEFYESLSEVINVFDQLKEAKDNFKTYFIFENSISEIGLELSLIDNIVEEWEQYKDCISGKRNSSEFDRLFYLQNTIVDNYHSYIFTIKNLIAILSNDIQRIPPEIILNLPNTIIKDQKLDEIKFMTDEPGDPDKIESLIKSDLQTGLDALIGIIKNDFKSGWLKLQDSKESIELQLYCNMIELLKTKEVFVSLVAKNTYLEMVYLKQVEEFIAKNTEHFNVKGSSGLDTYYKEDAWDRSSDLFKPKTKNKYKYKHKRKVPKPPKFLIEEMDKTLVYSIYFKDLLSVQMDLFEKGINEVKTVSAYEYLNYNLLMVGTQYNYMLFFEYSKFMAELSLFNDFGIVVKNSVFNYSKTLKSTSARAVMNVSAILYDEGNKAKDVKNNLADNFFYSIYKKKLNGRKKAYDDYVDFVDKKLNFEKAPYVKSSQAKMERMLLINYYIRNLSYGVFLDSITLQACQYSSELRKVANTVPKEHNIFEINNQNFMEIDKELESPSDFRKEFAYFNLQQTKEFSRFYIPTWREIFQLKSQTDEDKKFEFEETIIELNDNVLKGKFETQLRFHFFKTPTLVNKIENNRNIFFEEAFKYQSPAFLFLRFCSFYLTIFNYKYVDMCLTQKPRDIYLFLDKIEHGEDFWENKKASSYKIQQNTPRLPLEVVEKITENQKNFLSLRVNFDRIENEMDEVTKYLKKYCTKIEDLDNYMINEIKFNYYHWYHIFNVAREMSLKSEDMISFDFFTKILKDNFIMNRNDYFQSVNCHFNCHIQNNSEYFIRELFRQHFHFENTFPNISDFKKPNPIEFKSSPLITLNQVIYMNNMKWVFPFVKENQITEVRNLNFKISSMTKNYLIYIEKSELNCNLIELNQEKNDFLKRYIKLNEFKFKFIMALLNKYIPTNPKEYLDIEHLLKTDHKRIDIKWISDASINDPNEAALPKFKGEEVKTPTDLVSRKSAVFNSFKDDIFNSANDVDLKMKNSIIIEYFINGTNNIYSAFHSELKYLYLKKAQEYIHKENEAMMGVFGTTKNDLDISKFKNIFSSNFIKALDKTQISYINKKFSFFETFMNKLKNVSIEVETHNDNNAILINKDELDDAFASLLRGYIDYEEGVTNSENYSRAKEKYGNLYEIRKLQIWVDSYQSKLKYYDENLDKISNAKTALANNSLVYEMDNLYRQLKVLKDNIKIMEEYINDYFNDLFHNKIGEYENNISLLRSEFKQFKDKLVNVTNTKITEEYGNCIKDLKNASQEAYDESKKLSELFAKESMERNKKLISKPDPSKTIMEPSFFSTEISDEAHDIYIKNLDVNKDFHDEINAERKEIMSLQNDIAKLHEYYRNKFTQQRQEYENELDELRKTLSKNQDLYSKVHAAERNEKILKEELAKTQRSLASAEEYIKRLRIHIRETHDKNVELQKKISNNKVEDIFGGNRGGGNKANDLSEAIKTNYVYDMKNNVNLMTALDRINNNEQYVADKDIKLFLGNFKILQEKYCEEIDNRRNFGISLINIKKDIENMQAIHTKKVDELTRQNEDLKKRNEELIFEIDRMRDKGVLKICKEKKTEYSKKSKVTTNKSMSVKDNSLRSSGTFPAIIQKNFALSEIAKKDK